MMERYLAIIVFLTIISTVSVYGQQKCNALNVKDDLEEMQTLLNSILTIQQKTSEVLAKNQEVILQLKADVEILKGKCLADTQEEEAEDVVIGRDCRDLYDRGNTHSGVYNIYVKEKSVPVKCDMRDRGWIVFQHRYDGSTDFKQRFVEYQKGFGSPQKEHWLGLENLHQLTSNGKWELRVDLTDSSGKEAYAQYSDFKIGEGPGYRLNIGTYSGTSGDSLRFHNGQKFSSWDLDQDSHPKPEFDCSAFRGGAWWYNYCAYSNLNAFDYGLRANKNSLRGMNWRTFKGTTGYMLKTRMKIRQM